MGRKEKILEMAKGYRGRAKSCITVARPRVEKVLACAVPAAAGTFGRGWVNTHGARGGGGRGGASSTLVLLTDADCGVGDDSAVGVVVGWGACAVCVRAGAAIRVQRPACQAPRVPQPVDHQDQRRRARSVPYPPPPLAFGQLRPCWRACESAVPLRLASVGALGVPEHGYTYARFTHQQNQAGIVLNRKVLSELAAYEPYSFKAVVDVARACELEKEEASAVSEEGGEGGECELSLELLTKLDSITLQPSAEGAKRGVADK
eukprot:COSAG01_NODE_2770_length_7102_cov_5.735399_13_plen_262_part_00